ncbi:unnamed protein product [Choristocarpus tenellus]
MGRKSEKGGGKRPRIEVVFDPDARNDYLTGFRKRKQARRRFGLAMQQIKDRKERLEERKERRDALKDRREELGVVEDLSDFNIKEKARMEAKVKPDDLVRVDFDDGHTQAMFGDAVMVTTTVGIPDSEDEDEDGETAKLEEELRGEKRRRRTEALNRRGRGSGSGEEDGEENRWSLAAVSKRLAANMPAKSRKGAAQRATNAAALAAEKGKKGKKGGRRAKGSKGGSATALVDRARGGMPRAELGSSGSKLGKKRKRK